MGHTTKDLMFQRELDTTWKKMHEGSPDPKQQHHIEQAFGRLNEREQQIKDCEDRLNQL